MPSLNLKYHRPEKLSVAGIHFIARFEGFRASPYNDAANNATVGFGHLLHLGPVNAKDRAVPPLTWQEAIEILADDARKASDAIRMYVHAKISQPQHDALASFVFNVGVGAFRDSTLLRLLNKHSGTPWGVVGWRAKREVREQLLRWTHAGGRELVGLTTRRIAEGNLFTTGRYS